MYMASFSRTRWPRSQSAPPCPGAWSYRLLGRFPAPEAEGSSQQQDQQPKIAGRGSSIDRSVISGSGGSGSAGIGYAENGTPGHGGVPSTHLHPSPAQQTPRICNCTHTHLDHLPHPQLPPLPYLLLPPLPSDSSSGSPRAAADAQSNRTYADYHHPPRGLPQPDALQVHLYGQPATIVHRASGDVRNPGSESVHTLPAPQPRQTFPGRPQYHAETFPGTQPHAGSSAPRGNPSAGPTNPPHVSPPKFLYPHDQRFSIDARPSTYSSVHHHHYQLSHPPHLNQQVVYPQGHHVQHYHQQQVHYRNILPLPILIPISTKPSGLHTPPPPPPLPLPPPNGTPPRHHDREIQPIDLTSPGRCTNSPNSQIHPRPQARPRLPPAAALPLMFHLNQRRDSHSQQPVATSPRTSSNTTPSLPSKKRNFSPSLTGTTPPNPSTRSTPIATRPRPHPHPHPPSSSPPISISIPSSSRPTPTTTAGGSSTPAPSSRSVIDVDVDVDVDVDDEDVGCDISIGAMHMPPHKRTRKSYTREYKLKALNLLKSVRPDGKGGMVPASDTWVSRQVGVTRKVLRGWKAQEDRLRASRRGSRRVRVGRNKSRPDTAVPAAPENEYAGDVLEDQESKGKGVESSVAFGGDGDGAHGVGVDVAGKDFHSHHGLSHGNEHGGLRHQFKREGSSSGARDVEIVDATDGEDFHDGGGHHHSELDMDHRSEIIASPSPERHAKLED